MPFKHMIVKLDHNYIRLVFIALNRKNTPLDLIFKIDAKFSNFPKISISDSDTTDLVDGETHTIISNRIIMAIMTQENFSADTVGSATADIKWDIVTAPEG